MVDLADDLHVELRLWLYRSGDLEQLELQLRVMTNEAVSRFTQVPIATSPDQKPIAAKAAVLAAFAAMFDDLWTHVEADYP
jgi:hypothetical protein